MLFFTGYARNAFEIASEQIKVSLKKVTKMNAMMELTDEALKLLLDVNRNLNDFGQLLGKQWKLKRKITNNITTSEIDDIYKIGIKCGALGGKLLGAGGGGFILFYVSPEHQAKVKEALNLLLYVPIQFENSGSQILLESTQISGVS